jgi:hypothetical protein
MKLVVVILVLVGVALSGCANYKREVVISSNPPGATIYVNGEERGQTESKVILDYGKDPAARKFIQVRKNNHMPGFGVWSLGEVLEKKKFNLEPVP